MIRIISLFSLILSAGTASAVILSWDNFTTTVIQGVATTEDGLTYRNDVELIDTFTAGGTEYINIIGYKLTSAEFLAEPTLSSIYYERTNQPNEFTSRKLTSIYDAFENSLEVGAGSDTTFELVSSLVFTNPQGTLISGTLGLISRRRKISVVYSSLLIPSESKLVLLFTDMKSAHPPIVDSIC